MLHEIRELALHHLRSVCQEAPEAGMDVLRQQHGQVLAGLLVEAAGKVKSIYVLRPGGGDAVILESPYDLTEERAAKIPFVKPSGAQSPAVGPVLKRTYKPKDTPPYGPSPKILKSTCKAFEQLAATATPWQGYFQEISTILKRKTLKHDGQIYPVEDNALEVAAKLINEKETVFLIVADENGKWPGERQEYLDYLAHELAALKYLTGATPLREHAECPLCGAADVTLYPNAVKGAGLNIGNADRVGAFAGLDTDNAWKNFALCVDCADLLFIFKNHLMNDFIGQVAGERALVLPSLHGEPRNRQKFMRNWRDYVANLNSKLTSQEKGLLRFFSDQPDAQVVLQIIWANFGQNVEDVKAWISDILPSRLQALSRLSEECNAWQHPLAPIYPVEEARLNVALNALLPIFRRPGGKKAQRVNDSKLLFDLKRQLATAIYHHDPLGGVEALLWQEVFETAKWYFMDVLERDDGYGITSEGYSSKKDVSYLTLIGWVKHLARFLYFLQRTEVLAMTENKRRYQPTMKGLQAYFTDESAINDDEKAFSFLIGALFGKLVAAQKEKGLNISSNALSWLNKLTLTIDDLARLKNKSLEKLMTYHNLAKREEDKLMLHILNGFTDIEQELLSVGLLVDIDNFKLSKEKMIYFLFLGMAASQSIRREKKTSSVTEPQLELENLNHD
jgi:CRISPR-associated protein Csh1